jgi:hypothetical protein
MISNKLPESHLVFIGAVLAWRVIANASGLTARGLVGSIIFVEPFATIVVSTHALPSRHLVGWERASWANEPVEQLLGIGDVHLETLTVVPVFTATLTVNHHAMIIWATADAVLSTIVAFFLRRRAGSGSRSQAGASGAGWGVGGNWKNVLVG